VVLERKEPTNETLFIPDKAKAEVSGKREFLGAKHRGIHLADVWKLWAYKENGEKRGI
jgi:hypothetical protein